MRIVKKYISIIIFAVILLICIIPNTYSTDNNIENNKWKTLSPEQVIKENKKLKSIWQELKLTSKEISNIYPKGSITLNHFTNNSGEELDIGNIESLFNIEEQNELRDTYINKNMRAAENYNKETQEVQFTLKYVYDTELKDSPRKTFFNNASYIDWYLATMGDFKIETNATVTKAENIYTMILEFKEKDYYSCNEKIYIGKFNTISKAKMQKLNEAGLVKNFESYGTYKIQIVWEENQDMKDATITVI